MNLRTLIRTLLSIEVNTNDMAALRADPRAHVNSDEEVQKLRDLFLLIDLTEGEEDDSYDEH
jgi:hypothetical protein